MFIIKFEVLTTIEKNSLKLKVDIPNFDEKKRIEETIDWVSEVEWFFEFMDIHEER